MCNQYYFVDVEFNIFIYIDSEIQTKFQFSNLVKKKVRNKMVIEERETLTLDSSAKVNIRNLNIWYGDSHAIIDCNLQIRKNNVIK